MIIKTCSLSFQSVGGGIMDFNYRKAAIILGSLVLSIRAA